MVVVDVEVLVVLLVLAALMVVVLSPHCTVLHCTALGWVHDGTEVR